MAFPTTSREVMAYAKDNLVITLGVLIAIIALFPVVVPLAVLAFVGRHALKNTAPAAQTTVTTTTTVSTTVEPVREVAKPVETTLQPAAASEPAAPVALTGSAALMAKMRKSSATSGEKRVVSASAERSTTSARTTTSASGGDEDANADGRVFILHGGEAAREIAKELARGASQAVGASVRVLQMDDFRDVKFDQEPCVVIFVVETVENAQPAEAAGTCLRWFNRKRKEGTNGELSLFVQV